MSDAEPWLTVFAIPKAFSGSTATHQHNAIRSWLSLGPSVDVILCGDDAGVKEAALRHGARHAQNVGRNDQGTPLVNAAFAAARSMSSAPFLCYVNADIILMSDFLLAVKRVAVSCFLLCGRRWDVDLDTVLDFASAGWEEDLRAVVRARGTLHAPEAMDYFAFPRDLVQEMPPFAVGRAMWDNWFVFHARARSAAVVDASYDTMVVHQNHDYAHTAGGQSGVWHGPEARRNRWLAREMLYPFTIADATLVLRNGNLVRPTGITALRRASQSMVALALRKRPAVIGLVRTVLRAKDA